MIAPHACPLCSYPNSVDPLAPRAWILATPVWSLAQRASAKRGVRCAILTGCGHVTQLSKFAIVETPVADEAIAAWNAEAERLFTNQTWALTVADRAVRRTSLGYPAAETAPTP
jgi:hypothetical protein